MIKMRETHLVNFSPVDVKKVVVVVRLSMLYEGEGAISSILTDSDN